MLQIYLFPVLISFIKCGFVAKMLEPSSVLYNQKLMKLLNEIHNQEVSNLWDTSPYFFAFFNEF